MNATIKIDKAGRVVLPKRVREELQIASGDQLKLESDHDRIILRPSHGAAQLKKKRGIWVYHADEPLAAATVQETVERTRREREEHNRGKIR